MILRDEVFKTFIDVLNKYEYCILRNYEELPEVSNDIDVLINPFEKDQFQEELKKKFDEIDVLFIRKTKYVCDSLYFFDKVSLNILHIDLFTSHSVKLLTFISHDKILPNRIIYKNFFIPSPEFEFLDLLFTRFFYTGSIKKKYIPKLIDLYKKNGEKIDKEISILFTNKLSKDVKMFCLTQNVDYVEKKRKNFLMCIIRNNFNQLPGIYKVIKNGYLFFTRSIEKVFKPYGCIFLVDKRVDYKKIGKILKNIFSQAFLNTEYCENSDFTVKRLILVYWKCIKNSLLIFVTPPKKNYRLTKFLIPLKVIFLTLNDEAKLQIDTNIKMETKIKPVCLDLKDKQFQKYFAEHLVGFLRCEE